MGMKIFTATVFWHKPVHQSYSTANYRKAMTNARGTKCKHRLPSRKAKQVKAIPLA